MITLFLENNEHTFKTNIKSGIYVLIVLKKDQRTEYLTYGQVKQVLTKSGVHHRGLKVKLTDNQVGRVVKILSSPIQKITFPKDEHHNLIDDLNNNYDILTTRILNERNKYKLNDILISDIGYYLQVIKVEKYKQISDHPYLSYLTDSQIKQIGTNPFDIIYLHKVGKYR